MEKLLKFLRSGGSVVAARGREGGSWAGVGVALGTVAQVVPGPWGAVLMALSTVAGAVAVALPERGGQGAGQ